jgi:hypothetical protein
MRLITSIRKPCPSDRDRIVTTGPSRFQPARQKCCAEIEEARREIDVQTLALPTFFAGWRCSLQAKL